MKVALVTGSAKRLGKETICFLAGEGYFAWVHYLHSQKEAAETLSKILADGGQGALIQGDVGKLSDVERMKETIAARSGRLDVLVNNVGEYLVGALPEYLPEDFERTLQSNLLGTYYVIHVMLPLFPPEGGSIVNIGYAGVETPAAAVHNTAYVISKTGALILTKSYARSLAARGIRVNMVSPGLLSNTVEGPREAAPLVPAGRFGSGYDVVGAIRYLIGPDAGYVTGVNIDVAGGYMLSLQTFEP